MLQSMKWARWAVAAWVSWVGVAGGCGGDAEVLPDGLTLDLHESSLVGTYRMADRIARFSGQSEGDKRASLHLDIDGIPLDVQVDLAEQTLTEDAHDEVFDHDDRALMLALRDAVADAHPEVLDTLHGRLLVKVADRFAEVPIGPALIRRVVQLAAVFGKGDAVESGCGGDGVTCLPGTSGSSWAVFSATGVCRAEGTAYGDSVCRGRCGAGCNWFDEDYTWDCLDHDVCLDYSNDCSDEFQDAADDWVATMAPLCWSGTSRSKPPSVRECGDGDVDVGEECDDHNLVSGDACDANCTRTRCGNGIVTGGEECDDGGTAAGDGCSATCTREDVVVAPRLIAFGPAWSAVDEGSVDVVPAPELRVTLDAPAPEGGVEVALSSAAPATLRVPATVSVRPGETSAPVAVSGLLASPDAVTVTASLGSDALTAQVQVMPTAGIDIGGWQLVQTASNRTFTFPAGTQVGPGDVVVVARHADQAAFEAYWGVALGPNVTYLDASAPGNGGADWPSINGSETYELRDAAGASLDGPTVALIESSDYRRNAPEDPAGVAGSWTVQACGPGGGTPGAGPTPSEESSGLYISEISDASGAGSYVYEFVELTFD